VPIWPLTSAASGVLVSFSPDGLTWTIEPKPQVKMEMSGGVILPAGTDGTPKRYVVAGHGGTHYPPGRRMVLFQSYDFDAWDGSTVSGFNRVPQAPKVPRPETYRVGPKFAR
jgi:hypothetical protein